MVDLKYIERNFEEASRKLAKKGIDREILNELKELFKKKKELLLKFEEKRSLQKQLSKQFGIYKAKGENIESLKEELNLLKRDIALIESEVKEIDRELQEKALNIPNFPDDTVPEGKDESDNVEIKRVLEPREFTFKPKEHWELAEINGWIDFERGVKLAKSRFSLLRGESARLERALIHFFFRCSILKMDFEELRVPVLK